MELRQGKSKGREKQEENSKAELAVNVLTRLQKDLLWTSFLNHSFPYNHIRLQNIFTCIISFDFNKPLRQPGKVLFVLFYTREDWSYKNALIFFSRATKLCIISLTSISWLPSLKLHIIRKVSFTFLCLKHSIFPKVFPQQWVWIETQRLDWCRNLMSSHVICNIIHVDTQMSVYWHASLRWKSLFHMNYCSW